MTPHRLRELAPDLRLIMAGLEGVPVAQLSPAGEAKVERLVTLLDQEIAEAVKERGETVNEERREEILIAFVERFRRGLLE